MDADSGPKSAYGDKTGSRSGAASPRPRSEQQETAPQQQCQLVGAFYAGIAIEIDIETKQADYQA